MIQPSSLNFLGGTRKRISLPDIRGMSALEVSPFHLIALYTNRHFLMSCSSVTFPLIRSYRIKFYFSVSVAGGLELRPLGCAGNLPASPVGRRTIRLYGANGNGVYGTALRNGSTDTVFTETVTETDTENGNVRLETRCYFVYGYKLLVLRTRARVAQIQCVCVSLCSL